MPERTKTLLRAVIEATGLSRRKAFAAIRDGRVTADGRSAVDPSAPWPGGALAIDGRPLAAAAPPKTYLLMNKPPGVLSAVSDARGRRTVIDILPPRLRVPGLHPVGRLDRDTTGLLLLTNDGDLTYRLTHPKHEVEKEYRVAVAGGLTDEQVEALRRGVEIDGRVRRPVGVRALADEGPYQVAMVIKEGRKRQVRRMLGAVGARVVHLERVREGSLHLRSLPLGAARPLTGAELRALQAEGTAERPGRGPA